MMNKRISAVAAAAAALLVDVQRDAEIEAAAKLAAEKMPVKDAMKKLMQQMDEALNQELQVAIERYLKAPITDPEVLRGRLGHFQQEGDAGLTYFIDGTPVLWVGEAAVVREGDYLKATRDIRQLLPEPAGVPA